MLFSNRLCKIALIKFITKHLIHILELFLAKIINFMKRYTVQIINNSFKSESIFLLHKLIFFYENHITPNIQCTCMERGKSQIQKHN